MPEHRAGHPATAASIDDSRTLPTVPGVATAASTASASDDPAVPGTPSSKIPVDSAHIAHRTHRDYAPTRSQTPVRRGATSVRRGATSVRHGATPPRQAHAGHGSQPKARAAETADVPGMDGLSESAAMAQARTSGSAAIPGVAEHQSTASTRYQRHQPTQMTAPVQGNSSQQAFIDEIAPGAIATQQKYGVPVAVTIAQAIDESGWGRVSWQPRTTTCSGSRARARRAATRSRLRSTRTASGSRSTRGSGSTTTSPRASTITARCSRPAGTTRERWRTATTRTRSPTR